MKIVLFNEKLITIHELFEQTLRLRSALRKIPNNEFLKKIIQLDTQKRGYISSQKLIVLVSDSYPKVIKYINHVFPFEKISYTVLIGHFLRFGQQQQDQSQTFYFQDKQQISKKITEAGAIELISKILRCQALISQLKDQVLPQIQNLIPFCGQNLSCQDFSEYLNTQSMSINPEKILLCLNGFTGRGNSRFLQYKFYKENEEEQGQNMCFQQQMQMELSQITQITQRLANRVQNFGGQWLKQK